MCYPLGHGGKWLAWKKLLLINHYLRCITHHEWENIFGKKYNFSANLLCIHCFKVLLKITKHKKKSFFTKKNCIIKSFRRAPFELMAEWITRWPLDLKVLGSIPGKTGNEWKNGKISKIPPWTYFQFMIVKNIIKIACISPWFQLWSTNFNFFTNKKRGVIEQGLHVCLSFRT